MMFKKLSFNYLQIILLVTFCCSIFFEKSYAFSPTDSTSINDFDISKTFRIEASLFAGAGFKEFDLFKTSKDEIVKLSPGGGIGGKISLGYCLTSSLNINFELGLQNSRLSQALENADGSFSRTMFLGTIRYKIPITGNSTINIGGGAGYYTGGKLDIDASKIAGGGHNIYEYENTSGIHVLGEYESFISGLSFLKAKWSWCVGLRYYNIAYKIDSASIDGTSIPITQLPNEIKDEVEELDGSGIDVLFSLIMHL